MSKVALTGNNSGTGTFTIAAPNSNTDRTFDLPDEAGTVLTNASDIESQVKTATNATGTAPIYACRAWVNFDGTGTVAIRESGNVSSITDNQKGFYTINFATDMPDNNYVLVCTSGFDPDTGDNTMPQLGSETASSANIELKIANDLLKDSSDIEIAVFR